MQQQRQQQANTNKEKGNMKQGTTSKHKAKASKQASNQLIKTEETPESQQRKNGR